VELLNDMALFVEVVKARGFRNAAEAVGIPNSTVSRRISALEKAIGLRLLHRTTRKIELTEAGQIYFARCKRIVDEAKLAHEQRGEMLAQPSGVLRASLPVDFANIYLATLIAEFARQYGLAPIRKGLAWRRKIPDSVPLGQQNIGYIAIKPEYLIYVIAQPMGLIARIKIAPPFKSP